MVLPNIVSTRRPRQTQHSTASPTERESKPALAPYDIPSKSTITAATRTRLIFSLLTSFLFLISLVFTILVEVGNVSADHRPITGSIYFLNLDLSHVIPQAVPQAQLINSIARTLGLHDFYQVGLWNYCEGYDNEISGCSTPETLYWFNPVEIILSELLAGATIALPTNIISALHLVRLASHCMFVLFLAGACLTFLSILFTPLSVSTRWATFPIAILTFFSALSSTAASIIATVMFIVFRNVIKGAEQSVNIVPTIGVEMFAFMWIASGCAIVGWLVMMGECCCCASRRDVRKGRKRGAKSAWRRSRELAPIEVREMEKGEGRKGLFGRKKQ